MAQTVGPTEQLSDAVGKLATDTTELGIVVGDMFRYACAGLFGEEPETARFVAESHAWVAQAASMLDARVRSIIHRYRPFGAEMRRIVELQQAANHLARIADWSSHISDQALLLRGFGDQLLANVTPDAPDILHILIALVYEQMRGVFLVTAARDMAQARALVKNHTEVEDYFHGLYLRLTNRTKSDPNSAPDLQRVLMVATDMWQIGKSVVMICQATLFSPEMGAF
jgi:phosphate uptake regulator